MNRAPIDETDSMQSAAPILAPEPIAATAPPSPIRTLGRLLDDLERVRIMSSNRIAALEREVGGTHPALQLIQEQLRVVEHDTELALVREWRKDPCAEWAASYLGVGEKSIARLRAEAGDPADRPNPAKYLAYCGHGDPARIGRVRNMTQEELFKQGNPRAKKQAWLIATSMLKAGNRAVYDAAREKYADAVHDAPCLRCGPAGHPALPGSPLSAGHQHARALRATAKRFLLDYWIASRQPFFDAQGRPAGGKS